MRHGFVKVAAATPDIRVADCEYNARRIMDVMNKAAGAGVKLLILPELCVTGYSCGDLFSQRAMLTAASDALLTLCEESRGKNMLCVVGAPLMMGYKRYNCAVVIYNGEFLGAVPKVNIPSYGELYEGRSFAPAPPQNGSVNIGGKSCPFGSKLLFCCRELPDFKLGVEICEDLWVPLPPSTGLCVAGATVIANLSASSEGVGKDLYRRDLVTGQSARLLCGYIYSSAGEGESTTDAVFSGHNIIGENGIVLKESPPFENGMIISEIDVNRLVGERARITSYPVPNSDGFEHIYFSMPVVDTELTRLVEGRPFIPGDATERRRRCEQIVAIQSMGLKKRITHTGVKTAVVGISGGLDSCLALLVSVRAMDMLGRPRSDILAVTMPCFGTTERTRINAARLCRALGVTLREIDITAAVTAHFDDIGHPLDKYDVVFENSQARERTQVLMDIANQTGGLVVGTGDLSELALGWATYNGDHMSMYGVNASVPKTLIRHIVAYFADMSADAELSDTLRDILDTPVSPELLPAKDGEISQKTEHIVGPYELHDFYLYYVVRWGFPPKKVLRLALLAFDGEYDRETVVSWIKVFYRRFFTQQFKRSCLPDGPKVGSVSLSPRGDWRMPSDAMANLWLSELEEH